MGYTGRGRDDPYQALGVDARASQQDIVRAYRRAVQQAHPDARPHDPGAAARQFQSLTAAYDLLRDPDRRSAYDRGHPVSEPGVQPPRHRRPAAAPRPHGSPFPLGPPPSRLIWAGPVHVQPPVPPASQHGRSAAAEFDDPMVIVGVRPGWVWGWP